MGRISRAAAVLLDEMTKDPEQAEDPGMEAAPLGEVLMLVERSYLKW